MAATTDAEILVSTSNGIAIVELNRPKALNALNTSMVQLLSQQLQSWSQQSSGGSSGPIKPLVAAVVIKGVGGKAFCAGGDVKWCAERAALGDPEAPSLFFSTEYRLNYQISTFRLPYVALMDGIVMGGGAGLSVHGHFRVVTERTVFAMPECGIGLYPDIGASHFLTRLPGSLGLWLGLTGTRLQGVDVRNVGLATHFIPSHLLPELEARLQKLGAAALSESSPSPGPLDLSEVNRVLSELEAEAGPLPQGQVAQQVPWINHHFSDQSVADVLKSLRLRRSQLQHQQQQQESCPEAAWLDETLKAFGRGSPLSQCVTFELFRRTRHLNLFQCLQLDAKLVHKFMCGRADFVEGVRATLVERGRLPQWKYAIVEEVPADVVQSFFEDSEAHPKPKSPTSRM